MLPGPAFFETTLNSQMKWKNRTFPALREKGRKVVSTSLHLNLCAQRVHFPRFAARGASCPSEL